MSFIPIIAKADISASDVIDGNPTSTEKKGKITPAQMAQLIASSLASKTGILDVLNKCVATASSITSDNKSTVTFQSGYIVICGRLIECENKTTVEINTLEHPSGKIILSVDLKSIKQNEVKIRVVSSSYSLKKDDLNEVSTSGEYDYELYSYTTSEGTVTLTRSNTNYIPDISGKLTRVTQELKDSIFGTGVVGSGNAPLQGYVKSKGTIEERLTSLGFKSGTITFNSERFGSVSYTNTSENGIYRQGNFVFCNIVKKYDSYQKLSQGFSKLAENFRPKAEIRFSVWMKASNEVNGIIRYLINTNGEIKEEFRNGYDVETIVTYGYKELYINFGYEAAPIN